MVNTDESSQAPSVPESTTTNGKSISPLHSGKILKVRKQLDRLYWDDSSAWVAAWHKHSDKIMTKALFKAFEKTLCVGPAGAAVLLGISENQYRKWRIGTAKMQAGSRAKLLRSRMIKPYHLGSDYDNRDILAAHARLMKGEDDES